MASILGRSPSTVSREVRRNGGYDQYRAVHADDRAWDSARRPKRCKLRTYEFVVTPGGGAEARVELVTGADRRMAQASACNGRVGMWRGGIRIGLSVSASFVWRCLNSRANCSVSTPLSSNRTCRFPASGSRTKPHAFTHGRSCPSRVRRTSPKCPYRCERGYAPPLRRLTLCLARNHRRNRTAV